MNEIKKTWFDGICKNCGSDVEETGSDHSGGHYDCDYMNRCTNRYCVNHKWHHFGDDEELDYDDHIELTELDKPRISNKRTDGVRWDVAGPPLTREELKKDVEAALDIIGRRPGVLYVVSPHMYKLLTAGDPQRFLGPKDELDR